MIRVINEEKSKLKEEAYNVSRKFGLFDNLKELIKINDDFEKEEQSSDHYEKTIKDLLNKQNGEQNVAMFLYVEHQKIEKLKERIVVLEKEKKEAKEALGLGYGSVYNFPNLSVNHLKNIISDNKLASHINNIPKRKLNEIDLENKDRIKDTDKLIKKQKLNIKDEVANLKEENKEPAPSQPSQSNLNIKSLNLNSVNPFENTKANKLLHNPAISEKQEKSNEIPINNNKFMNIGHLVKKNNSILNTLTNVNNLKQSTLINSNINQFNRK